MENRGENGNSDKIKRGSEKTVVFFPGCNPRIEDGELKISMHAPGVRGQVTQPQVDRFVFPVFVWKDQADPHGLRIKRAMDQDFLPMGINRETDF